MKRRRSGFGAEMKSSAFDGYRFPPNVILMAVRWYLRFGLSYRDLEELLAEGGSTWTTSAFTRRYSTSLPCHGRRPARSTHSWSPLVRR